MTNLASLKVKYAGLFEKAQILPARRAQVDAVAERLCRPDAKQRYQVISAATGVPWHVIAVIHEREADQDFTKQLGQGDPLNQPSRHVPRGRGPFFNHPNDPPGQDAFYRGAVDALQNCPPKLADWHDWTAGGACVATLLYNGTGYDDYHHENSPYEAGATDQEERGKYTSDGQFNAGAWDTQIGCIAMFKAMMAIDPSIKFSDSDTLDKALDDFTNNPPASIMKDEPK